VTTIVVRDGVMASDSMATRGPWVPPGSADKLFRMVDGGVAAVTGDYAPGCRYIGWLNDPKGDAPNTGDATVIRLHPDNTVTIYECGGSYREDVSEFCAAALAALHMGADAAKAVAIAALVDAHTGGAVITMKCEV
jgi:hypothetical protein